MNIFRIILVLLIASSNNSCEKKEELPKEHFKTLTVAVTKETLIEYDTEIGNFLGAVDMIQKPLHAEVSELFVDTISYSIYHRYKPKKSFVGKDTVKLKSVTIDDTSDELISTKYVTVILTIK